VASAMDTEIGRLIAALDADTTIVLLGDNGTAHGGVVLPLTNANAKNTLYEGGVNVPLIIAGPLVAQPGSETSAMVQAVDLFATLADMAKVPVSEMPDAIHGQSLLPILNDLDVSGATHQFASLASANEPAPGDVCQAVRDARWKLIQCDDGTVELYDLQDTHLEGENLLSGPRELDDAAAEAMNDLTTVLADWLSSMTQQRDRLKG
jgi:arylsulfatase B